MKLRTLFFLCVTVITATVAATAAEEKLTDGVTPSAPAVAVDREVTNDEATRLEQNIPVATVGEARDFGLSLLVIGGIALALAIPILLILAILFLIPIPTLYFPRDRLTSTGNGVLVAGRFLKSVDGVVEQLFNAGGDGYRGILDSQSCVQRISCEIMRASKNANLDKLVYGFMNDMPVNEQLKRKITGAAKLSQSCRRYKCEPLSSIWKIFSS